VAQFVLLLTRLRPRPPVGCRAYGTIT